VGEKIPSDIVGNNDLVVDCPGLTDLGDEELPLIEVVVGQLLGFFRCLHEGLRPDSPSEDGVISRVVPNFKLHIPAS
jgi:tagatose-6-phosphate ketose/aldose isomerase